MLGIYDICVRNYGWNLRDIDETDFETLVEYFFYEKQEDTNTRQINGKTYVRAKGVPKWL